MALLPVAVHLCILCIRSAGAVLCRAPNRSDHAVSHKGCGRVCCVLLMLCVCVCLSACGVLAGLCGGSGIVPGGNIGEKVAVFEQVG
jgi:hypothetical protein